MLHGVEFIKERDGELLTTQRVKMLASGICVAASKCRERKPLRTELVTTRLTIFVEVRLRVRVFVSDKEMEAKPRGGV